MATLTQIYQLVMLSVGVGGVLWGMFKLVMSAQSIKTTVELISTNHIPHLQADLTELRQAFITHLNVYGEH